VSGRLRAGDLAVTSHGAVVQVLCDTEAVLVAFDDDSTAVLPIESLTPWRPATPKEADRGPR
jgi:hypothetical protein